MAEWEAKEMSLRSELSNVQGTMKTTVTRLETQLVTLQTDLAAARQDAEVAANKTRQAESSATQTRGELDSLRQQYTLVEERAREAENRVQMFLDQFENSVDNYRRQSHVPGGSSNGDITRHRTHDSIASADSLYSHNDGSSTPEAPNNRPASTATRNSMALDNLASELDALRSHWETTNKAYRLSDRFDFERTPTKDSHDPNEGISQWRDSVDSEISIQEITPKSKPVQAHAGASTAAPQATNGPPAGML